MLYFKDTMTPFIVPEMTFKGHSRSSAMQSFFRSPGLPIRDRKVGYTYFQTKTADIKLKVDQGHWRWQHSIGQHFLLVVCSNRMFTLYRFLFNVE